MCSVMTCKRSVSSKTPDITFSNGLKIPIIGLGTWKSNPKDATKAVEDAIDIGYRHFDCAKIYGNEKEIGKAIKNKIDEGKVKREDLFITTKLWNTFHRPDLVEGAARDSLKSLGLDYVDLYLMHWPMAYKEGGDLQPLDEEGKTQFSEVDYVDTWKEMEKLLDLGLTRLIGVSNFNRKQLERVLEIATIRPVNNQVECHPYFNQKALIEFCKSEGIVVTAYSPLGSPGRAQVQPGDPVLLEDQRVKKIGSKYGKTSAQVVLRYQVQRGVVVIPKSVTKSRIQEDFNIFDFELSLEDMNYLGSFGENIRFNILPQALGHPLYPFNDEV